MERKTISVKLRNCALSCNVTLQRYLKDLLLWTYKKSAPTQIFFKTIQSYFRAAYPNQLLE